MPMININQELKTKLDELKTHKRDTYGDILEKLLKEYKEFHQVSG